MAEEDLLFGKNRHMFGGIEPSNMLQFSVARYGENQIQITAQLPNDTIVNDQTLCTVEGAIIRRKTSGYPTDEFDGDYVGRITESGEVTLMDTAADADTVYFYAAFPYTTQGVYNRNPKNRAKYNQGDISYYYGFDIDLSDSNPATRVTYPADVMNANYTAAKMNKSTDSFDYGGWPNTPGEKFMPRPCVVTVNSSTKKSYISYYLDPNDYSKSINGTNVSGHGSPADYTKYMVEWPKIYTHRETVNGIYKFRCCDKPLDDDWDCWCNYDEDGNQIDHFYMAVYQGLYAYSGSSIEYNSSVTGTKTHDDWIDFIQNQYGADWNPSVLADRLLIQDLLIMMAKTTDLGTAYYCWQTSSTAMDNGIFDKKGMFYGNASGTGVKVFGMEHVWSNLTPRLLVGCLGCWDGNTNISKAYIYAKITSSTHDGTKTKGYKLNYRKQYEIENDYIATGAVTQRENTSGYINCKCVTSYGRFMQLEGSSTTYECDYGKFVSGTVYPYLALVGMGNRCGPFSMYLEQTYASLLSIAAITLSYKPKEGNHSVI